MRVKWLPKEDNEQENTTLKDLEPGTVFCFANMPAKRLFMKIKPAENEDEETEDESANIEFVNIKTGIIENAVEEAIVIPQDGYYVIPPR